MTERSSKLQKGENRRADGQNTTVIRHNNQEQIWNKIRWISKTYKNCEFCELKQRLKGQKDHEMRDICCRCYVYAARKRNYKEIIFSKLELNATELYHKVHTIW